ncbi:MAG: DUF2194 domain-containing protein [Blautia sp.]|nr:DUF2194 domain-containing protein [Blautia sp.]
MVSRRNFVTITMMLLILTFMFMFTGVIKEALNEYDVNRFEDTTKTGLTEESMVRAEDQTDGGFAIPREYVLFVGSKYSQDVRAVVSSWCTYTKRGYEECESLADYAMPEDDLPEVVVVDGQYIDVDTEFPFMRELTDKGVHLIMARMPHHLTMAGNPEFCDFLGIRSVRRREILVDGVHLFDGFLLGGERIYATEVDDESGLQDLEMVVHWYTLGSGTKTYVMGMLDENEYKNEEMPAIVWRKSTGSAYIFCVNASYMSNMYGMGFLSAMMAETDVYEIYPIVNAQCMTVAEFSAFSEDNTEELMSIYSSRQPALYESVIWPSLISVTERTGAHMTLMAAPQLDYDDGNEPENDLFPRYMALVNEEYGEIGASMGRVSETSLADKMSRDVSFYMEGADGYTILSMYAEDLDEVMESPWEKYFPKLRTIATAPDSGAPPIGYLNRDVTLQRATAIGREHPYSANLAIMGYETALGYSNIVLDMKEVSYPETEKDYWQNLARTISQNLCTYWKDYKAFTQTTLAESDARVRRFLALDYRTESNGNQILLHINEFEDSVWFLVKFNNGKPGEVQGGALQEMGGGYYLLEATETEVTIDMGSPEMEYFYQ